MADGQRAVPRLMGDAVGSLSPDRVFPGDSELAGLMRALDWRRTPLGPVEGWPQALKTCVHILLTSRQPMWLGWGEQLTYLYNDPYKAIIGGKHPWALGRPTAEVWREIWDAIGPRIRTTMRGEEGTYDEALLLIMERHGYPEETYYTFSYTPVPDERGGGGGLFCANTDDTRRVVGERQLALLREQAAGTTGARTVADACARSARALETNPHDLPFALLYLVEADPAGERRGVLAGTTNIAGRHPIAPAVVALDGGPTMGAPVWPLAEAVDTAGVRLVDGLDAFPDLPRGAWDRAPRQAAILPITAAGETGIAGVLVVGLNPYRRFDDAYRGFLALVAGQIAAAIGNAQIYEEERRRAEALAELDRAKTAFFSNISHEFRTPLTLMLGPVEDLLAGAIGALTPGQREELAVVHRNSLRLLRLVNTLLDFSRLEAGRVLAVYSRTNLAALTAELVSSFDSAVGRAGLRLVVDCPPLPEGVAVYVDRDMWEKIVLNLLSNAIKFTFDGEIAVTLHPSDDRRAVTLTVRDTGTGIATDELPRLFERFHRIHGARARTQEGTGIGLALIHELVRLHGGSVAVESTLGRGTTFTVTLPIGKAHLPADRIDAAPTLASTALGAAPFVEEALHWLPGHTAEAPEPRGEDEAPAELGLRSSPSPAEPPAAGAAGRILLADDSADMRAYVARLLEPRYAVEAVADGAAALAAARARPPDLVLTDVMMPGLDGFALLRALRADPRTREVPVVLLSARAGEEATVEGVEAGADDYLVKPFAARELLARVGTHLELAHIRSEAAERERAARRQAEALARENDRLYREAREQTAVHVRLNAALRELAEERDRARAETEAERRRLHDLFMQAPAMVAILRGPEHVYELANPLYLQLIGRRSADAVLGQPIRAVVPEIEAQGIIALLDHVYTSGEPFAADEFPVKLDRRGDGTLDDIFARVVLQPFRDGAGQVAGILAHVVEVTELVRARQAVEAEVAERRRAEAAVRHSEDRLRRALAIETVGVIFFDPAGDITWANEAFLGMSGFTEEDVAAGRLRWDTLTPPEWMPASRRAVEELKTMGSTIPYEKEYFRKDGSRWWGLFAAKGLGETEGVEFILDITDRKQAEALLTDQRAEVDRAYAQAEAERIRLQQVLDVLPAGVSIADTDRRFVLSNRAVHDLLGFDFTGQAMPTAEAAAYEEFGARRLDGSPYPSAELPLQRSVLRGETVRGERFVLRNARTGRDVPVLANSAPLVDATGRQVGGVVVVQDITTIQDLERQKDAFLSAAAHDLQQPVAAIRGHAQLARRRLRRDGPLDREGLLGMLASVEEATGRLGDQIAELLDIGRLQMGRPLELERTPTDLVALVRRATAAYRDAGDPRPWRLEAAVERLEAAVDAARLRRVLDNLLANATKFSAPDTEVVVAVGRESGEGADWAVLTVRDRGIGIPAADLPNIFERFYRAGNATGRVAGTGIGLAGARQIVEQHGGTITVESREGQGSTFTVRLPL